MVQKNTNSNLHQAKNAKKDEFYTQLPDIENELKHYRQHFKDKVVYCNCDDPRMSNFFHYFSYNFEDLGLKKLITTLLMVHGSRDKIVPYLENIRFAKKYFPQKMLRIIPIHEKGHVFPISRADQVITLITNHLDSLMNPLIKQPVLT